MIWEETVEDFHGGMLSAFQEVLWSVVVANAGANQSEGMEHLWYSIILDTCASGFGLAAQPQEIVGNSLWLNGLGQN